ncbi:DUF262 domain-containing protein [Metamycoplasma equirhinis]|uniref:DUF262 domain-containing protein n=1 Tax=Metamycoplasma equirhinis TaxID=92402 RepID=UPI003592FDE2
MENQKNRLFELWKIGTNIKTYIDNYKDYAIGLKFRQIFLKKENFAISIFPINQEQWHVKFAADLNDELIFYKSKRNDKDKNDYSKSTIDQYIRIGLDFGLLTLKNIENNIIYELSNEFQALFENNNSAYRQIKFDQLIFENTKLLLCKYKEKLESYVNDFEDEHDEDIVDEKDKVAFSIFIAYLHIKKYKEVIQKLILNGINKSVSKKTDCYFYDFLDSQFNKEEKSEIFSVLEEILKYISKFFKFVISEEVKEMFEISFNTKEHKIKNIIVNEDQKPNISIVEMNSIGQFIVRNTMNFEIPIYQRKYVWKNEQVKSLIETLFSDMNDNFYTYLNNIIITSNDKDMKPKIEIIDGQQRITTMILILLALAKYSLAKFKYINEDLKELFFDLESAHHLRKMISNYEQTESLYTINLFINIQDIAKNKNINTQNQYYIRDILEDILVQIDKFIDSNEKEFENFLDHVVNKTYFSTIRLLKYEKPEKLFQSLNQNMKALTALDLFKNYFYGLMNKNNCNYSNISETIDLLDKEFIARFWYLKNNKNKYEIDALEKFLLSLYFIIFEKQHPIDDNLTKDIFCFNVLKECFDEILKNNENSIKDSLFKLIEYKNKFFFIWKLEPNIKLTLSKKCGVIIDQIYAATYASNQSISIVLIWTILNKYNAWNAKLDIEDIKKISQYLFEIERFIFYWKIVGFKGESLSEKMFSFSKKILRNEIDTPQKLRIELINSAPKLKEYYGIGQLSKLNEELNKELKKFEDYNLASKDTSLNNNILKLILIRINFYLLNKENIIVESNSDIIKNSYAKLTYEHEFAIKCDDKKYQELEEGFKYIIGNGMILDKEINTSRGKKMPEDKEESSNIDRNILIYHGYKDLLLDFKTIDFKKISLNEFRNIWIRRSQQIVKLFINIYCYKDN